MATDIYARIRQVAFELVEEGAWPTVVDIRNRLGTGSNTTINATLKDWRKDFLSKVSLAAKRPGWPPSLVQSFEALWQEACTAAEHQFDEQRQAVQAALAEVEQEKQGLLIQVAEGQKRESLLSARLDEQVRQLVQLETQIHEQSQLRQVAEGKVVELLQSVEVAKQELASSRTRHDKQLHDVETKANQRVLLEKEEATRREALAYERLEGLRLRLYEQMEEERLSAKEERTRLEQELVQTKSWLRDIEQNYQARAAERDRDNGRLAATVELLESRCAGLDKELMEQRDRASDVSATVVGLVNENTRLALSLTTGFDRYWQVLASDLHAELNKMSALSVDELQLWLAERGKSLFQVDVVKGSAA